MVESKRQRNIGVQYIENQCPTNDLIDIAVTSSNYIEESKTNEIKMYNDFHFS